MMYTVQKCRFFMRIHYFWELQVLFMIAAHNKMASRNETVMAILREMVAAEGSGMSCMRLAVKHGLIGRGIRQVLKFPLSFHFLLMFYLLESRIDSCKKSTPIKYCYSPCTSELQNPQTNLDLFAMWVQPSLPTC